MNNEELSKIELSNILFLDIETVPVVYDYNHLDEGAKYQWNNKFRFNKEQSPEELYSKAGVYSEFAKIICIGCGYFNGKTFRVKYFSGDDEAILLKEFCDLLNRHFQTDYSYLCAHNGKEFDFPFIARRMVINKIEIPNALRMQGKKPWEIKHLDTLELWKFGDYKHYTSLDLLAHVFQIPSPKSDIDGSQVAKVFYEDNDLERICKYCLNDVVTLARVYLRMMNQGELKEEFVELIT
jgi:3'-5' exonuclease